jgi:hypothetical protein
MEISKGAVGILAAVSLTAGAAGAYLANRGTEPAATETAPDTGHQPGSRPGGRQGITALSSLKA